MPPAARNVSLCALVLAWVVPAAVASAETLAALGNSQLDYCGGSLVPLAGFAEAAKVALQARQFKGSATFSDHLAKLANLPAHDFVLLTNQQGSWDSEGVTSVYASAEACHRRIVTSGAQTILYLTYATGTDGSSSPQEMRTDEYLGYWETVKARLDVLSVGGRTSEALLVPVMQLWQEGKHRWPLDRNAGGDECDRGFMHDALHGGYRAQFATAALLFAYVTCLDPRKLAYQGRVDATFAGWAKQRAWELANEFHRPKHCRALDGGDPSPDPAADAPDGGTGSPVGLDAAPPTETPQGGAGGTYVTPEPANDDDAHGGGGDGEDEPRGPPDGAPPDPPTSSSGCTVSSLDDTAVTTPAWLLFALALVIAGRRSR